MGESLGKLLLDPLAERWKGVAIGGSLVLWLVLGSISLFTRQPSATPRTWPVDCRIHPGHARPLWCTVAGGSSTATVVLIVATAVVIGTAFLSMALAPAVLRVAQGRGWGHWPVLPAQLKRLHAKRRRGREQKYPTAAYEAGIQPTRVANRFAALSDRVCQGFGLDIALAWDLLVCVVPADIRAQLAGKSSAILLSCQHVLLCVGATVGGVLLLPGWGWKGVGLLAGLAATGGTWRRVASGVDEYCDMVMATLLLYNGALYTALGETPPGPAEDMHDRGQHLGERIREFIR
jgi:hypothetical protein